MKALLLRAVVLARRHRGLAESTRREYRRRLEHALDAVMALAPTNRHGQRLRKRYGKLREHLFTFLDHPDVTADDNSSERELRPTATYRKVTGGFRSAWGADLYAAVRSVIAPRRGAASTPIRPFAPRYRASPSSHRVEQLPERLAEETGYHAETISRVRNSAPNIRRHVARPPCSASAPCWSAPASASLRPAASSRRRRHGAGREASRNLRGAGQLPRRAVRMSGDWLDRIPPEWRRQLHRGVVAAGVAFVTVVFSGLLHPRQHGHHRPPNDGEGSHAHRHRPHGPQGGGGHVNHYHQRKHNRGDGHGRE